MAGAEYGFTLLWAVIAACVVAFCFQRPVIRFTLATGTSAMEGIRQRMARKWAITLKQNLIYGVVMLIVCPLALRVFLVMLGVI